MKKIFLFSLFPFILSASLKEYGGKKLIDIISSDEMMIDLELNSSDISSLPKDKRLKINLNLLPFTLPPIFPNISFKLKVLEERKRIPQIVWQINYGEIIALRFLEKLENIKKARYWVGGMSFIIKKGLKENASIFSGIKKIKGECEFNFTPSRKTDWIPEGFSSINFSLDELAIFSGLYITRKKTGFWSIISGYIPERKKIFSKICLGVRKHWAFSIGIYPDSVFTFHPMINLRW